MTKTLNARKNYALNCLIKTSNPNTRAFDSCFEEGDGREVVKYIMRYATQKLPPVPQGKIVFNSPEWRLLQKHERQKRLAKNLIEGGFWGNWTEAMQRWEKEVQS